MTPEFHQRARSIIGRYPVKRSALIMLLHEVQLAEGFVSADAIRAIAAILELEPAEVAGVTTFYTMFKSRSQGRYLISLCTNVSCQIYGADETAAKFEELIGPPHQPTDDGLLCWEPVECLAYCHAAPAVQVNYSDVGQISPERAEKLCSELRCGRPLDEVINELSQLKTINNA